MSVFLVFLIHRLLKMLVSDFCITPHNWDYYFRRPLPEPKIAEFAVLSTLIRDLHPSFSRFDSRNWSPTSSGTFSVPPLLRPCPLALQLPHFPIGPLSPSKVQAFIWKVAWDLAPTLDIIQSFYPHLSLSPISCPLYVFDTESIFLVRGCGVDFSCC